MIKMILMEGIWNLFRFCFCRNPMEIFNILREMRFLLSFLLNFWEKILVN